MLLLVVCPDLGVEYAAAACVCTASYEARVLKPQCKAQVRQCPENVRVYTMIYEDQSTSIAVIS